MIMNGLTKTQYWTIQQCYKMSDRTTLLHNG